MFTCEESVRRRIADTRRFRPDTEDKLSSVQRDLPPCPTGCWVMAGPALACFLDSSRAVWAGLRWDQRVLTHKQTASPRTPASCDRARSSPGRGVGGFCPPLVARRARGIAASLWPPPSPSRPRLSVSLWSFQSKQLLAGPTVGATAVLCVG